MSEKKRGRPRDRVLDDCAHAFEGEVQSRMSAVNRRDMRVASYVLRLDTPEGQREFAYIFNNGKFRMSVLTELGRYSRRYRMTSNDVREFARVICREKVKAKKVREMLMTYNDLNSKYIMNSSHTIELASAICQGKLKLNQVERVPRASGIRPRTCGIEYIKENYPEKFQEIIKGRKTVPQVKQEIENEIEYKETEYKETKRVGDIYVIKAKNLKDYLASGKKVAELLYTSARTAKTDEVELILKPLEEEEIDKLIREGKVRLISKKPEVFVLNEKD
ncbi:MAG: hypothetical protein GTO16_02665 [Candidatus Aminicenantes bacterium]|nr:hypothetical protein [Candidatus Aminicenantes bacterium]